MSRRAIHSRLLPLAAGTTALLLVLSSCGDDAAAGPGGGGPDVSRVKQELLDQVNLSTEGLARFSAFKEVGRKVEEAGDMKGCVVTFEGEIEFDGKCYYHMAERKKGDRLKFEATAEFIKDGSDWKPLAKGIYPR